MRIVVDAMGGDNAPFINVAGALSYLKDDRCKADVILVGVEEAIKAELIKLPPPQGNLEIYPADEVVEMDDSPTRSYKEKPDSSLRVGMQLVRKGEADAIVSAGNSGATMAYSLLTLGRITGVDRPGVGAYMPHETGTTLLMDVGAVSEAKPKNLLQFGIMGSIVYSRIFKQEDPRVALLSIGEEASKGTTLVREAYRLLNSADINFTGYVEGRDIFANKADVVVTDGFTGNVALKLAETTFQTLFSMLKNRLNRPSRMLGAQLIKPVFNELFNIFDPNNYGGSPLLGIKGISLICHGSSTQKAIKNALFEAQRLVRTNLIDAIENDISASLANITYTELDEELIRH